MKKVVSMLLTLWCLTSSICFANLDKTQIQQFIQEMVTEHHFNRQELTQLFAKVNYLPQVINNITRPYETKPWYIYRQNFLTPKKIQEGVAFWRAHQATLNKVSKEYGVPSNIIVAIIGVESAYGQYKGKYSVLDSLSTLAFAYPPRAKFFRKELKQFLLLTREQKLNPRKITGSYAGAIGWPQFMPSSYRHFAVDYSKKGSADLVNSADDVIASIANYLKLNGWQRDSIVASLVIHPGHSIQRFVTRDRKPTYSLQEILQTGITTHPPVGRDLKANVIGLTKNAEQQQEYWLGFKNFYVIMTYNPSPLYAMAVYQLAEKIQAHR
ncbi:MAG: lytic murein transglycosylase B [Legionellales bacterium]|nr:lytic murein transglycosylase B [Legionellales bacterium]